MRLYDIELKLLVPFLRILDLYKLMLVSKETYANINSEWVLNYYLYSIIGPHATWKPKMTLSMLQSNIKIKMKKTVGRLRIGHQNFAFVLRASVTNKGEKFVIKTGANAHGVSRSLYEIPDCGYTSQFTIIFLRKNNKLEVHALYSVVTVDLGGNDPLIIKFHGVEHIKVRYAFLHEAQVESAKFLRNMFCFRDVRLEIKM